MKLIVSACLGILSIFLCSNGPISAMYYIESDPGKSISYPILISDHHWLVNPSLACEFCNYKATSKEKLVKHRVLHTGEKPYLCDQDQCDFKASTKSRLDTHKKLTHIKEKYVCDHCEYRTISAKNLARHKKNANHLEEKQEFVDQFNVKDLEISTKLEGNIGQKMEDLDL